MSSSLTDAQRSAVEHFEGPLLVLAGPGSGKTRVITHRIARLMERGIRPENLLALTFTNKAAREMSERVERLVGGGQVRVSTFHRFCSRLLRRWPEAVGLRDNFTILDHGDQVSIVRSIMKEEQLDTIFHEPSRVLSRISRLRNDMVTAVQFRRKFEQSPGNPLDAVVYQVFPLYESRVLGQNSVDFDDLLLHVVRLLDDDQTTREKLDRQFRFILVDEYQDTNLAQYHIVHAMSRQHPNLCVTGDPDQSIYGWRGARPGNISTFERDFPDRVVVSLDQNFRSTKRIVKCADQLITNNRRPHRGELTTDNAEGDPVRLQYFEHPEAEADGIARNMAEHVAAGTHRWSDFAVFYRINALSRLFETAFARHQIPYQVAAGYSFFERAEVRDLVAYLRLIENASDNAAFERIVNRPTRGIGASTVMKLRNHAERHRVSLLDAARSSASVVGLSSRARKAAASFADLIGKLHEQSAEGRVAPVIERLIAEIDYLSLCREDADDIDSDRAANVMELVAAARQYDERAELARSDDERPSLQGFLELATLSSEVDSVDPKRGAVSLMTLHASKGLEFPSVWIVGLENGLIPHERAVRDGDPASFEEERRLLFVGVTRAMRQLTLTQTMERTFRGLRRTTISSPFMMELLGAIERSESIETPVHVTAALLDDRIEQARRRFEAAQKVRDRGQLMTAAELAARLASGTVDDGNGDSAIASGFRHGMTVRHPQYGRGVITELSGGSHRATVTVRFESAQEPRTFVAGRCPLQPVGVIE